MRHGTDNVDITPMLRTTLFSAFLACISMVPLSAENWPQWRGPALNGTSAEKDLPLRWSKTENITWALDLPAWSGSTPIVWGDRVFLNVAEDLKQRDGDNLFLWCVDRNRGAVLWKRSLGGGNHREQKQNMSSPSPVTDGRSVWAMTGTGVVKAFDFEGKELWMRDIQKDYGRFGLNWGYGSSPLLHDDALIVQVLHGMKTSDPSYLLRIDKASGYTTTIFMIGWGIGGLIFGVVGDRIGRAKTMMITTSTRVLLAIAFCRIATPVDSRPCAEVGTV